MSTLLSADGPWGLLARLRRLVAERTPADLEIPARFAADDEAVRKQYQQAWEQVLAGYEEQKRTIEAEYASEHGTITGEFSANHRATQKEFEAVRYEAVAHYKTAERDQKNKRQEAHWEATTVFEATKDGPDLEWKEIEARLTGVQAELQSLQDDAVALLRRRWQWREYPDPPVGGAAEGEPRRPIGDLLDHTRERWRQLHYQPVAGLFEGARPVGLLLLIWLAVVYPFGATLGWQNWYWAAASTATAAAIWVGLGVFFYSIAKRQASEGYLALRQALLETHQACQSALQSAKAECDNKRAAIVKRLHDEMKRADDQFAAASAELCGRHEVELAQIDGKYPALLAEIVAVRDSRLQEAKTGFAGRLRDLDSQYAQDAARLIDDFSAEIRKCRQEFEAAWGELSDRWLSGMARLASDAAELNQQRGRLFPAWDAPDWDRWQPPEKIPPVIPFGRFRADLGQIEGGVPGDARLEPVQSAFSLPALLPWGEGSLFLLKASGEGRGRAVEAIQNLMLRMLTSMPPGKVRFTIIDPVGLGENFSAFMHLADYDDQLVTSRIWTESGHIEARLGDLTEHMENVIQAYLRNEFRSIREYNEFAGEMAEPYRVLVIANFPVNFTENAARRLASIVASGARCGVYTVLSIDGKLELPRGFHLADVEAHALDLTWEEDGFVWRHPEFGRQRVELERPPAAEHFTELVRMVGARVKEADRVEVPFECVVPEEDAWWTADSRSGIDVPLGRAGAMKLQHLELGKGTAQHVLIAGRTGSGKSTLLHALITSVSLHYDPDEVELYLIDFKKGVEFKAFASYQLPHARVVAIESEREFGLSVLERLDQELRTRGDLFRAAGVQDLKGFRAANPGVKMPRVLLIVDEFQELFVEDDRIAQNAALLLDRLVRQGRAFGVHVLLGSQTLAGAYSLPRSTIGQMAVRIALQCSEADAHLILSEENTAARLLTRPGEAIYNDANGLYEGNHPFQVVWLPDVKREVYLTRIGQLAAKQHYAAEPPIVFEGNAPADPSDNSLLQEAVAAPSWDGEPSTAAVPWRSAQAWLGASVAIKSPTVAVFTRQGGSNLLVVGQREEEALGMLATGLISLAAQQAPGVAGSPGVIIYNLVRFRELRKAEDDFGFSRRDEEPPNSAAQLADVLREGPALGIHALLWCDTYNTVQRWLDRQALRDLDLRALFQMSAADSSSLIDSPAASRLGVHRAILYDEEQGRLEKFRPYGVPARQWLDAVKSQFAVRVEKAGEG